MKAAKHLCDYAGELYKVLHQACITYAVEYQAIAQLLIRIYDFGDPLFVFGNGGSAAVANHSVCDHVKGIREWNKNKLRTPLSNIRSLCSDIELITAIANDHSYDQIFAQQLRYYSPHQLGVVVALSVSGSSPNVVEGLKTARELGHKTIAFVGKNGGAIKSQNLADYIIHFECDNFGIVEDCFSTVMHSLAQYYASEGI